MFPTYIYSLIFIGLVLISLCIVCTGTCVVDRTAKRWEGKICLKCEAVTYEEKRSLCVALPCARAHSSRVD